MVRKIGHSPQVGKFETRIVGDWRVRNRISARAFANCERIHYSDRQEVCSKGAKMIICGISEKLF